MPRTTQNVPVAQQFGPGERQYTNEIADKITKRRIYCIVHRICYYVYSQTLVTDQEYDRVERELKALALEYPEIAAECDYQYLCPVNVPGSSVADSYPTHLLNLAKSLLAHAPRYNDPGYEPEPCEMCSERPRVVLHPTRTVTMQGKRGKTFEIHLLVCKECHDLP